MEEEGGGGRSRKNGVATPHTKKFSYLRAADRPYPTFFLDDTALKKSLSFCSCDLASPPESPAFIWLHFLPFWKAKNQTKFSLRFLRKLPKNLARFLLSFPSLVLFRSRIRNNGGWRKNERLLFLLLLLSPSRTEERFKRVATKSSCFLFRSLTRKRRRKKGSIIRGCCFLAW